MKNLNQSAVQVLFFFFFAPGLDLWSTQKLQFMFTFLLLSLFHSFRVDVGNPIFLLARHHVLMNGEIIPDDEFCFGLKIVFFSQLKGSQYWWSEGSEGPRTLWLLGCTTDPLIKCMHDLSFSFFSLLPVLFYPAVLMLFLPLFLLVSVKTLQKILTVTETP